jgi:WD40 repeat protein
LFELDNGDLASGGYDGDIFIWNMKTGDLSKKIETQKKTICSLTAVTPENIACGHDDGNITILNVNTGATVHFLSGHERMSARNWCF